jgi:hypothetical protein
MAISKSLNFKLDFISCSEAGMPLGIGVTAGRWRWERQIPRDETSESDRRPKRAQKKRKSAKVKAVDICARQCPLINISQYISQYISIYVDFIVSKNEMISPINVGQNNIKNRILSKPNKFFGVQIL